MKAFLSTSALFLYSMTALASAASDEDPTCMGFRLDLPGLPMEKVLPRDQGRLPSGPGYAATAALDAWRFSHGESDATRQGSAQLLARAPLKETLEDLLNTGCMDLERDGDLRRNLSDDLAPFIDAEEARRVAARRKRDTFNERPGSKLEADSQRSERYWLEQQRLRTEDGIHQCRRLATTWGLRGGELESFIQKLQVLTSSPQWSTDTAFSLIAQSACPVDRRFFPKNPPSRLVHVEGAAIQNRLQGVLRNLWPEPPSGSHQPVVLEHCAEMITAGRLYPRLSQSYQDCKRDWSLAIGRRRDSSTGRCQVLLRQSRGASCKDDRGLGKFHSNWKCEEGKGQIWVDLESLEKNVRAAAQLQ